MRAPTLLILLAAPLAAAASAPVQPEAEPIDVAVERARAEAIAADAEVRKLQLAASKALDSAAELRSEQLAAAEAIHAAEARISAANAEIALVEAQQAMLRSRLMKEQQPASALLAGMAMMARRPPLLALADSGSTDALVEVRMLLDATLPVIRARTAALSKQVSDGARLKDAALATRAKLAAGRSELDQRRRQFAALERKALQEAAASRGQAIRAGDFAIAANETVASLSSAAERARAGSAAASALSAYAGPPPGPAAAGPRPLLAYALPVDAPVAVGLGAVSASGVRARGVTFSSRRGSPVLVPASGTVRFAGPFRTYDGVVIIDHGAGWMSLLVNVATQAAVGERVAIGDRLGRAMGPVEVELSRDGTYVSPALIAGSSASLSNDRKGS